MKLFHQIFAATSLLVVTFVATAQTKYEKSFITKNGDISAVIDKRMATNGKPAPLIKVNVVDDCQFKGNTIGDIERRKGQYWVYIEPEAAELIVTPKNSAALVVKFADYGITLTPGLTYQLTLSKEDNSIKVNKMSPDENALDLGLSVLWATHNVGTNSDEEKGTYYQWGREVEYRPTDPNYVSYNEKDAEWLEVNGYIDMDGVLSGNHDPATQEWGKDWRSPSIDECKELVEKCKWYAVNHNGVNGFFVEGPNGNYIFLPVSGKQDEEGRYGDFYPGYEALLQNKDDVYRSGFYWANSLDTKDEENANNFEFRVFEGTATVGSRNRSFGMVVRPVTARPTNDEPPMSESTDKIYVHYKNFNLGFVPVGENVSVDMPYTNVTGNKPATMPRKKHYIADIEVTYDLWNAVMENVDSTLLGKELPVVNVSPAECEEFLQKLRTTTPYNFDLPTYSEWYYIYTKGNSEGKEAWTSANSDGAAQPVGKYDPNDLGVYDMAGNVSEWCRVYTDYEKTDPINLSHDSNVNGDFSERQKRYVKAGSSFKTSKALTTGRLETCDAETKSPDTGLRLVLVDGWEEPMWK